MAIGQSTLENMVEMKGQELLEKAYRGKKVFLTGHTGFKGSWLLLWLHSLGAEVKGYALAPENKNDLYHLIEGDSLCHSVIADIRDRKKIKEEVLSFQPDFIFHLAAQPLVRLSYQLPVETFETNITGTANLLDAMRFLDKPCDAVMITTDKVYENLEKEYHYKETDRLGGFDPYSASKAAAEIVISSYRNSFFNLNEYGRHQKSIAVARAGNVIGGGDRAKDRIIPDIIRALESNEDIIVRNPEAVRPWQHVLEPVFGYLLLGARLKENPSFFGDAWNFGPEHEDFLKVGALVELAIQSWGNGKYKTPELAGQPHEAGLLQLDNTKAKTGLGWTPGFNSETAIRKTMDWYRNAAPSYRSFTLGQIKEYISR
jgi:CDP-glucose 4,6-dehydratase